MTPDDARYHFDPRADEAREYFERVRVELDVQAEDHRRAALLAVDDLLDQIGYPPDFESRRPWLERIDSQLEFQHELTLARIERDICGGPFH